MSMNILVAEDNPHTRAALAELLRKEGHQVTEAADGLQAKSLFDSRIPDLACLDVMMPGLSGFDLCRHFRQVSPRMPILFITAKAEEIDKVVGLELGGDDYIVKPFGTKEVIARIRAVMRRCLPPEETNDNKISLAEDDFQMHDLHVMPRALRAARGEETFELTAREIRILQLLAHHQGEVVSREELFRVAWNEHHIPNSRTLDQTVSQLRKRIEHDPKQPKIIQTVYGVGYRFE
ncbi:response regulator transcription factor [Rubripirellula sp.]|jgi:DNA-binding response OmpR family regulator|nr:response regulator transcription factor [Planctomycetaceae bacterium]MDA9858561.1 response regulator transcription factor [Rubripirellula sp.]MDF1843677.1 response regulator transcription factor [Rubripirellula sp.]